MGVGLRRRHPREEREEMTNNVHPGCIHLPCGGIAYFDEGSGMGYRCHFCMAMVGSIGQPKICKDEAKKYDVWKELGGKEWDYINGGVKNDSK